MRVAIAGAGAVGRSIARELLGKEHEVLLIDKDAHKVQPDRIKGAEWLLGDACEVANLEEAQLEDCDVVVGATGDDKVNLVVSLLAKTEFAVQPGRRPDQPPGQRVAVHRGLGRRRRGVDAAGARRAGRGGGRGRRHRAAVRHPRGPGQPASSSPCPTTRRAPGKPVRDLDLPKDTALVASCAAGG